MPLRLILKPYERFIVNGAVFSNTDRYTHIILQNDVRILREEYLPDLDATDSPETRCHRRAVDTYFLPIHQNEVCKRIEQILDQEAPDGFARSDLEREARLWLAAGDAYRAITLLKRLASIAAAAQSDSAAA